MTLFKSSYFYVPRCVKNRIVAIFDSFEGLHGKMKLDEIKGGFFNARY